MDFCSRSSKALSLQRYIDFVRAEARWLFFGLLLAFVSSLGQTFFISLFSAEIRADLGLGHSLFASYYAIGTIAGAIVLFWAGRWIDHVPLHLFTGCTLIGLALAGFVLASVPGPLWLILAFFMLRLFGQGLSFHISATSMARWFARNRGKAISIAGLGMPIGEAILPPLVAFLLLSMHWRDVWWLLTTIVAVVLVPITVALVWRGGRQPKSNIDDGPSDERPSWDRAQVLRDKRFWLIMPAVMGPPWIFTGVFFHQVAIVNAKGWEFAAFAMTYSAYAGWKVATALISGSLVDRYSAARVAPWTMPIMSAGLAVLVLADVQWGAWLFMTLVGIHVGVHMTSVTALWPELYGRLHIGAIKSLVMSIGVFVSALGPPLFGVVLDFGWGAETLIWICVVYGLVAAVMMAGALKTASHHDRPAT